jgi:hypothetical protein
MATKKQKPGVAKRVADRKAFVKDKVASKGITAKQARQRFYVQTRMAEMKAKGKTVTPEMRKQLQQKFQSGNVARKGFAAPAKKVGVAKPLVTKPVVAKPAAKSVTQAVRSSDNRSAANISSTRTGTNANHSQRSAPQVIRKTDVKVANPSRVRYPPRYIRQVEANTPGKKVVVKKK